MARGPRRADLRRRAPQLGAVRRGQQSRRPGLCGAGPGAGLARRGADVQLDRDGRGAVRRRQGRRFDRPPQRVGHRCRGRGDDRRQRRRRRGRLGHALRADRRDRRGAHGRACLEASRRRSAGGAWLERIPRLARCAVGDGAAVRIGPDDECNIIYSSGTTGLPKGIVHSHRCRLNWAMDCGLALVITAGRSPCARWACTRTSCGPRCSRRCCWAARWS